MKPDSVPKSVRFLKRLYARLLFLYPKTFSREYGGCMAQVFGDRCREAFKQAGKFGLIQLWFQVAMDLGKSALIEHWYEIQRRSNMLKHLFLNNRLTLAKLASIFSIAFAIFFVIVAGTILVTARMPKYYASTARICANNCGISSFDLDGTKEMRSGTRPKILERGKMNEREQIALKIARKRLQDFINRLQSKEVTEQVFRELDLATMWAIRYGYTKQAAWNQLRKSITMRPIPYSLLIDIRVLSRNPEEAATIANKIGQIAHNLSWDANSQLYLACFVDSALPGWIPVSPNPYLNFALGSIFGAVASLLAAIFLFRRLDQQLPPPALLPQSS